MKLILAVLALVLLVNEAQAKWYNFPGEAIEGAKDMWDAYQDMKGANWKNSDKYFHARGNYEAAKRGPGGMWAAEIISDVREALQDFSDSGNSDSEADQKANHWGRNGGDPNHYRPQGLPDEF
ncbi:serum amyloid A-5 protein-like [Siphateles boraxobius]|uniref:serum amyloid A-5 protein-like n=1 Tax=Siphateles boraxobius TaxID=180520 RepID=UPI00406472BB